MVTLVGRHHHYVAAKVLPVKEQDGYIFFDKLLRVFFNKQPQCSGKF